MNMDPYAADLWQRAKRAWEAASRDLAQGDYDACASRAYYAAFYAVSSLFAGESREFKKHSALEAAVHRDLVKTGRWAPELGQSFRSLHRLRDTGDYGGLDHVSEPEASEAVRSARQILDAVDKTLSGPSAPLP